MNYSLDFDGSPQDLTMTLTGAVDAPSIRAFIEEMVAHPQYRAGMLILVDLSDLDTSTITQEQYEGLGDAISGRDHRFPSKAIAIVAPNARTYDDEPPYRGVEIRTTVTIADVDTNDALRDVAVRYLGREAGDAYAAGSPECVRIRLEPGNVRAWDFADITPG